MHALCPFYSGWNVSLLQKKSPLFRAGKTLSDRRCRLSDLMIVALLLVRAFGWLWIDPLVGIVGVCLIASWGYGLICYPGVSC